MKTSKPPKEHDLDAILRALRCGRENTVVEPGYYRRDYYAKLWKRSNKTASNILNAAVKKKLATMKVFYIEVKGCHNSTKLWPTPHWKFGKH